MKKLFLLACIISLTVLDISAQAVQWAQIQDICPPNMPRGASSPQITSDGTDLISLGQIAGPIIIGNTIFGNGNGYLAKHDNTGSLLWSKYLIGTSYDLKVATDRNKNIFVTGHYDRTLFIDSIIFNTSNQGRTFFLAKFNAAGSLLWARTGNAVISTYDPALTTDGQGNVYVAGVYTGTFSLGTTTITPAYYSNAYILKYDTNGNFQWLNNISQVGSDYKPAVIGGPNNEVYVASISRKNSASPPSTPEGTFLRKFNNVGIEQWSKFVPRRLAYYQPYLSIDSEENVYMAGTLDTTLTFGNHTLPYVYGSPNNTFLAKITASGSWKWAKQIPTGPFHNHVFSMEAKASNELTMIRNVPNQQLGTDIRLLKIDTSGTVTKTAIFNDNSKNTANSGFFSILKSATNNAGDTYISGILYGDVMIGAVPLYAPPGIVNSAPLNPSASFIGKVLGNANTLSGTLYIDTNANGIRDSGEGVYENGLVEITPGPYHTNSLSNGTYSSFLPPGNFNLKVTQPAVHYTFSPQNHNVSFAGTGQTLTRDFALVPIPNRNDVRVSVTNITATRPGFVTKYQITFENIGTTTLSDSITLNFDPNYLTFTNSTATVATQQAGKLQWYYQHLEPREKRNIDLEFSVAVTSPLGTVLKSRAVAGPLASDFNIENNFDTLSHLVTGSYDPNDKQVSADQLSLAQLTKGEYLDYIIRFQNTGTDTAFTVTVRDSISSKLNMTTFELVSASHPYTFRLLENGMGEWRFDNILLPDSNRNEPGSHGFIRYRIKPHNNLKLGDIIKSRAAIYFDFNAPIYTNNAITRIRKTKGQVNTLEFDLYPNPARDFVTVYSDLKKPTAATVRLVNILGQIISEVTLPANSQLNYQLPLNNLPKGVYIVQLETENGRQAQRLVVQ